MTESWEPEFYVDDWLVRPTLNQIERGDHSTQIEPRSMGVLLALARCSPKVATRQRLISEVWGEAFVTDEVISHAVWELRKAFGDDARNPRFIQTVPKKGYRLLAKIASGHASLAIAPGTLIGRYQILDRLGSGAMGVVFRAQDTQLKRPVALKFLPSEWSRDDVARKRFLREARAAAGLDHLSIATVYEVGETPTGQLFIAMTLCLGESLRTVLERGPLPLKEGLAIAREIARGLAVAHQQGIVHRDIKPANVMVSPEGQVRLLDFGLAKLTDATTLTHIGSSPGTPAYKSPEQTRGDSVDHRTDIWSLGVLLYEMVCGRLPFRGEYEQAVIYAILHEEPQALPSTCSSPGVEALIRKALAKDPWDRYASVNELVADLTLLDIDESPVPVRELASEAPLPRRWLRRRGIIAVSGIVMTLLLTAGVFWLEQHASSTSGVAREIARLTLKGELYEWLADTAGSLERAEATYRQALALDPENAVLQAQLAACLARLQVQFPQEGRFTEIEQLVESALRAPREAMPWVAQAKLRLLKGDPVGAVEAARKAIKCDPRLDRGHTLLGEALLAQKDRQEEGFAALRRGVELAGDHVRARLALGFELLKATRFDEAANEFRQVLAVEPDHPSALHNLGVVYLYTGRDSDAVPLFRRAFEVTRDARAASNLGLAYFHLDLMYDAITAFGKAYELEPGRPVYAHNLGDSYEKLGQLEEARHWFELALKGYDRSLAVGAPRPTLLARRAVCAAKLGRLDEAGQNIEEALARAPNDYTILFNAAEIAALGGRRAEVYAYLERAIAAGFSREEVRSALAFRAFHADPQFRVLLENDGR